MQALTVAKGLDVKGWFLGGVGAFVSGGAGAVSAGFGTMLVDPDHFNLGSGAHHLFEVMGITFLFSAVISLAKYLQLHPTPTQVPAQP